MESIDVTNDVFQLLISSLNEVSSLNKLSKLVTFVKSHCSIGPYNASAYKISLFHNCIVEYISVIGVGLIIPINGTKFSVL